jgi:hypothetical protein
MSEEIQPELDPTPQPAEPPATARRPGLGMWLLIVILTTAPLLGLMYLGAQLLQLPFLPADLFVLPIRAGFAPWASLVATLTGAQAAAGGNPEQSAPLVQAGLGLALFLLAALAYGLAFYAFVLRRGRVPDLIDGVAVGALFAAPMIAVSLIAGGSPLPALLQIVWLAGLFIVWGIVLSYAFGRLMTVGEAAPVSDEAAAEGAIGRRQFLYQFGAGAAAITAVSAAAGAALAPGRKAEQLQRTLPMISPELAAAQQELFGEFRRFAIVRGGTDAAEDGNVLALGAEYPDRNYVSVWLGGHSPIVVYDRLESALAAYSTQDAPATVLWLDG